MVELARPLERSLLARGAAPIELARATSLARFMLSSVGAALVARGLSEDVLASALVEAYGLPGWDGRFDAGLAEVVGESTCWRELLIPVEQRGDRVTLAVADPSRHDVHDAVRFATRARAIDLVVAPDTAITQALMEVFPWPGAELAWDLARLAERHSGAEGAERLGNCVAVSLAQTKTQGARIECFDVPRVLARVGDVWRPTPWLSALPVDGAALVAAAEHVAAMAEIDLATAPAGGWYRIQMSRCRQGGAVLAIDVACERTIRGLSLVVTPAVDRRPFAVDFDDSREFREATEALGAKLEAGAQMEARFALDRARSAAARLDAPGGIFESELHGFEAWFHERAGDLVAAARALASSASCPDAPPIFAWMKRTSAAFQLRLAGRAAEASASAKSALEGLLDLFGAPGALAADAAYEHALAALDQGDVAQAAAEIEVLSRWAETLRGDPSVFAAHARARLAKERGAISDQTRELRDAIALAEQAGERSGVHAAVFASMYAELAAAEADAGRRDRAAALLGRAAARAADLAPSHPVRRAVEGELSSLAPSHPYR